MKTRNGFVSNSSSSSFIVGFTDKVPTTIEETKEIFKLEEGPHQHPYQETVKYSQDDIAVSLLAQMIGKRWGSPDCDISYELEQLQNFIPMLKWKDVITDPKFDKVWETAQKLKELEETLGKEIEELESFFHSPRVEYDKSSEEDKEEKREKLWALRAEYDDVQDELMKPYAFDYDSKTHGELSDLYDDLKELCTQEHFKELQQKYKTMIVFKYADEDGSFGSFMEHSGVPFANVEHIQISHH